MSTMVNETQYRIYLEGTENSKDVGRRFPMTVVEQIRLKNMDRSFRTSSPSEPGRKEKESHLLAMLRKDLLEHRKIPGIRDSKRA
jgi:hypothetical protein